jgi:Right handed beta helix region
MRTSGASFLIACAIVAGWLALPGQALGAATFVVNRTGDAADLHPGDGKCDSSTSSGNQCTLRAAIQESNALAGADTINFNITTTPRTISPASPLPPITGRVTIDGYSQTGASANTKAVGDNAVLAVVLDGVNAGSSAIGLQLQASNSVVKGLDIQRFAGNSAIEVDGSMDTIRGNFIGTDKPGATARPNLFGVSVYGSNDTVGGTAPSTRNLISGNTDSGINVAEGTGVVVQGNYIGTNAAGTAIVGTTEDGIFLGEYMAQTSGTTIGGTSAAARNVIVGSTDAGIFIQTGGGTHDNVIEGNYIGVGADGTTNLANPGDGIDDRGRNNTIGGSVGGSGNVIAHSGGAGVHLEGANNTVQSNLIEFSDLQGVLAEVGPNTIKGNALVSDDEGVRVLSFATGITITANQILNSGGQGINLIGGDESGGFTANDSCDRDTGANNLQNFPVLTSAVASASTHVTILSGSLNSVKGTTFRIEAFLATDGATGHGEAEAFVASATITTAAKNCIKTFQIPMANVPAGLVLTTTATNMTTGDTSEFSGNVIVIPGT